MSPEVEADQLSAGERSTIRRTVEEAVAEHGQGMGDAQHLRWDARKKYGISYGTIEYLLHDDLPDVLPEELLTAGQRNRIRQGNPRSDRNAGAKRSARTRGLAPEAQRSRRVSAHLGGAGGRHTSRCRYPTAILSLQKHPPEDRLCPCLAAPPLPEPGQVVEVRGSTWAVARKSAGPSASPADDATVQLNHVIDLQSLDEDRLGEQLSVIWELEVGRPSLRLKGYPSELTPKASMTPSHWRASLTRCVGVRSPRQTPTAFRRRSGRVSWWRPTSSKRCAGPSLALGPICCWPTTSDWARPSKPDWWYRTVCAVSCPYRGDRVPTEPCVEMARRDARQVRPAVCHHQQRANGPGASHPRPARQPFQLYPRVIVNMAWLPQVRCQRLLRDVYAQARNPKLGKRFGFDILIVDEAHHVAPSSPSTVASGRGYSVDTQRTVAVRQLAEVCEHRLFLSATPHNGYPESFTALMEMNYPRRFSRGALLDSAALKDVTVRRLKSDLKGKGFKARESTSSTLLRGPMSKRCSPCLTTSSPVAPSRTGPNRAATLSRCSSRSDSCPARSPLG